MKRSNRTLVMMLMAMGCITLLILSNVLYTMTSARHFRTGMNVKEYKDGDIVKTEVLKAKRGSILDRSGEILAKDEDTYTIIAVLSKTRKDIGNQPAYVQDIDKTARLLAPKLGLEEAFLRKKLQDARNSNMYQTEFGEKGKYLSNSVKESIAALKLPGIEFQSSVKRTYPNSVFASHLLGFAQYDEAKKKITGQIGLEAALDEELSGTNGSKEYQKDADGNPLPGTEYTKAYAKDGDNVVLTLDRNVQQTLQSSLDKSVKKTSGGVRSWGIVMEVKTGKILGWASSPSFNLNSRDDIKDYVDLPSDFLYEPGSVMKGITYAAAVDSGHYPYNKTFDSDVYHFVEDSKGNIHRTNNANDQAIYDAEQYKHGTISFDKGFVLSSNIGICELLASYMEPSIYKEYLEKFGFLKSVDTPYLSNKPGEMQFTYALEKLSTGFGQAINVNALQMAQAFSAIFNDGTMMRPYVVDRIERSNGTVVKQYEPKAVGKPISEKTSAYIQKLMKRVVDDKDGTARMYRMEDVDIIAKTGTGQVYGKQGYDRSLYTNSIMMAAPAKNPKVMVYYAFQASDYLNYDREPAKEVMRSALVAANITADKASLNEEKAYKGFRETQMPVLRNHSLSYALDKLKDTHTEQIIIGDGSEVMEQFPQPKETIISNQRVFLLSNGGRLTMPDMTGWTKKDITAFWKLTHIAVEMDGTGMVASQNIKAGKAINKDTVIQVTMK